MLQIVGAIFCDEHVILLRFAAIPHKLIKVLPAEAVANPERKRRFVQEAKAASALNHPNILHIYDIDQAGAVDFIATLGDVQSSVFNRELALFDATHQRDVTAAVSLARARRAGSAVTASLIPAPAPRISKVSDAMIHGAPLRITHSGIWRMSPADGGGTG